MADREPTYDCFALHSLVYAPGWHAVHWDVHGHHFLTPVHLLALATRRTYTCQARRLVDTFGAMPEDECREVVGIDYAADEGFLVCNEAANFCGLLPPTWTLDEFARDRGCQHLPPEENPFLALDDPSRTEENQCP